MIFEKSKYGPSLKNTWIYEILASMGITKSQNDKSLEIYETFKDYLSLEQCSKKEAVAFTAKYYHISKPQMIEVLRGFGQ